MTTRHLCFWLTRALLASTLLAVTGCGGGGGDGGPSEPYIFVGIGNPDADVTVTSSIARLDGEASCPECPADRGGFGLGYNSSICQGPYSLPDNLVNVSWKNRTTGESGIASDQIAATCGCAPFFGCVFYYRRYWGAIVPLGYGANDIEITATGVNGGSGSASRKVTRLQQPLSPTDVSATAGSGQVTIAWSSVSGATGYNLYWSTSQPPTFSGATKIGNVLNPYTHLGLQNDVTHYYWITAETSGFEGPPSERVLATPGWPIETVTSTTASASLSRHVAIAVDATGNPHFNYSDPGTPANPRQDRYATRSAGAWTSVLVDNLLQGVSEVALDLDPSGAPHIAYLKNFEIRHAFSASGTWTSEVVDTAVAICGSSFAVVLDAAGHTHVAYRAGDEFRQDLWYATNATGSWIRSVAHTYGTPCDNGWSVALAVDATGVAHIFFGGGMTNGDDTLRYATNPGGSWNVSVLEQETPGEISAAVDSSGKLHVGYVSSGRARYAQNTLGVWSAEDVETGNIEHMSLAVDAAANPHVSYFRNDTGELVYARKIAGTWQPIVVEDAAQNLVNVSTDTAIAVDTQGKIHIGYFDPRTYDLKYATNGP